MNFATLVGHSNLRAAAVGLACREASPKEIDEMKRLAAEAMAHGAFGISSGLIYAPSCFADCKELIEVTRAAAACGGIHLYRTSAANATRSSMRSRKRSR